MFVFTQEALRSLGGVLVNNHRVRGHAAGVHFTLHLVNPATRIRQLLNSLSDSKNLCRIDATKLYILFLAFASLNLQMVVQLYLGRYGA
jgi:hypothetical protein